MITYLVLSPESELLKHMYGLARKLAPGSTEELCYAMPALKYKGKGLLAIIANKHFLSLYPFSAIEKLNVDLSAFECTNGSIHFSSENPISDDLLRQIVSARMHNIDRLK